MGATVRFNSWKLNPLGTHQRVDTSSRRRSFLTLAPILHSGLRRCAEAPLWVWRYTTVSSSIPISSVSLSLTRNPGTGTGPKITNPFLNPRCGILKMDSGQTAIQTDQKVSHLDIALEVVLSRAGLRPTLMEATSLIACRVGSWVKRWRRKWAMSR